MSELDRVKEQLVYLRFWLGIMVATEIALVGWLVSTAIGVNCERGTSLRLAVVALFVGIALDAAYRK
jgi:hypothetical protein